MLVEIKEIKIQGLSVSYIIEEASDSLVYWYWCDLGDEESPVTTGMFFITPDDYDSIPRLLEIYVKRTGRCLKDEKEEQMKRTRDQVMANKHSALANKLSALNRDQLEEASALMGWLTCFKRLNLSWSKHTDEYDDLVEEIDELLKSESRQPTTVIKTIKVDDIEVQYMLNVEEDQVIYWYWNPYYNEDSDMEPYYADMFLGIDDGINEIERAIGLFTRKQLGIMEHVKIRMPSQKLSEDLMVHMPSGGAIILDAVTLLIHKDLLDDVRKAGFTYQKLPL